MGILKDINPTLFNVDRGNGVVDVMTQRVTPYQITHKVPEIAARLTPLLREINETRAWALMESGYFEPEDHLKFDALTRGAIVLDNVLDETRPTFDVDAQYVVAQMAKNQSGDQWGVVASGQVALSRDGERVEIGDLNVPHVAPHSDLEVPAGVGVILFESLLRAGPEDKPVELHLRSPEEGLSAARQEVLTDLGFSPGEPRERRIGSNTSICGGIAVVEWVMHGPPAPTLLKALHSHDQYGPIIERRGLQRTS